MEPSPRNVACDVFEDIWRSMEQVTSMAAVRKQWDQLHDGPIAAHYCALTHVHGTTALRIARGRQAIGWSEREAIHMERACATGALHDGDARRDAWRIVWLARVSRWFGESAGALWKARAHLLEHVERDAPALLPAHAPRNILTGGWTMRPVFHFSSTCDRWRGYIRAHPESAAHMVAAALGDNALGVADAARIAVECGDEVSPAECLARLLVRWFAALEHALFRHMPLNVLFQLAAQCPRGSPDAALIGTLAQTHVAEGRACVAAMELDAHLMPPAPLECPTHDGADDIATTNESVCAVALRGS